MATKKEHEPTERIVERIIVTGGPESTYLGRAARTNLWKKAAELGVSRQAVTKWAIEYGLTLLDQDIKNFRKMP